jgi:predicted ArsR family transcriptional regulator
MAKVDWTALEKDFTAQTQPEGAISIKDYAEHFDISYGIAVRHVANLVQAGKLKPLGKFVQDGKPTKFYEVVS